MLTTNQNSLEYACSVISVCDALLLETSYKNKSSGNLDTIIGGDERAFVVNRLEKVLRHVIDIFGDAYIPSSFYIDNDGVCGFSLSFRDRVISDMLDKANFLDALMNDYIVLYIKNDWNALMGEPSLDKVSDAEIWKSINSLFSYKYAQSYEVEEV